MFPGCAASISAGLLPYADHTAVHCDGTEGQRGLPFLPGLEALFAYPHNDGDYAIVCEFEREEMWRRGAENTGGRPGRVIVYRHGAAGCCESLIKVRVG